MRNVRVASGVQPRVRVIDVLVVEDDADCRELLVEVLMHDGFVVRACAGADAALFAIDVRVPDAIITDLAMPGGDGRELARAIRRDPRLARVPIVATSGRVDPHWDVVRHFDAYLRKPLDLALVPELLRTLVESPGRGRARMGTAL